MSTKRPKNGAPSPNGRNGDGEANRPPALSHGFSDSMRERGAAQAAAQRAKAEAAGLVFVPGAEAAKQDAKAGRDAGGRFGPGNRGGPGNPHAKQVAALRAAMLEAVTPAEIKALMRVLLAQAKGGDVRAIKEILDRTLGRAEGLDLLAKVAELESAIDAQTQSGRPSSLQH